ncbi:roundabout homolog 1-like isoform X1 [Varroa destructor]|uniref:Ig-like domain-containing protein n=1 Tax=Varroa destructor TaxID=109461 RepID=A0A7M7K1C3_VARDE|nr:roundabout homolog 1-like isoform X1 [Varroa destructor]
MCLSVWIIVCTAFALSFPPRILGKGISERDKLLEFIEQPKDTVALRDDPAQLNCRARSLSPEITDADIQIQWFHNGKLVKPSLGRTVSLGVLFLVSVHTHDVGVYWCQASIKGLSTRHNSVRSNNATLQIAYLREEFLKVPSRKDVPQGGTVVLECAPPPGLPPPTIEWLKEGVVVNVGSGPSSRLRLEGLGNLVISDVRASDQGGYVCKADNAVGNRETPPANLRVILHNKPKLIIVPENKTVLIPENGTIKVLLECSAAGDPLPRILWRQNSHELTGRSTLSFSANDGLTMTVEEDRRGSVRSSLEISGVRPDDQGNYTCEAENSEGRVAATAQLTVHYRPRWVMPPEDRQVKLSNPLILRCEATGNPSPEISWSRGSSRWVLSPGESDGDMSVDSYGSLRIPRTALHHAGVYICTARSLLGQITTTARVDVLQGGVPIISHPEHPLGKDLFSSPWLLLLLSAILCLILICVAVTILLLLRKMNSKTQSAVTEVPVAKGGDVNFFTDLPHPTNTTEYFSPRHEKMVLYENKLNILDCIHPTEAPRSSLYCNSGGPIHTPISGPYAATTIVPPVLPGTRVGDTGNYRTGDIAAVNRSKAYPVARGAQGTHELENLLHSGYSNSASSSSETSSFGKRSGRSSRSSSNHPRIRAPSPSLESNTATPVAGEPIYSMPDEDEANLNKAGSESGLEVTTSTNRSASQPIHQSLTPLTSQLTKPSKRFVGQHSEQRQTNVALSHEQILKRTQS